MYSRDQPEIEAHALKSPAGFIDCLEFVLTTIQAALSTCRRQRRQIRRDGLKAACLWGSKPAGLKYGREHAPRLLDEFKRLRVRLATEEAVELAGGEDVIENLPEEQWKALIAAIRDRPNR